MAQKVKTNPVDVIRQKCVDCCGGLRAEADACNITDCPLHPWRFGKNPYRKKRESPKKKTDE